jgi:hypothetical protein
MRRIVGIKPVHIMAHPSLYQMMEELGKEFKKKNGISLSQPEVTKMIAENTKVKIPNLLLNRRRRML